MAIFVQTATTSSAHVPHVHHVHHAGCGEPVARLYDMPEYHDDPRFAPPTPLPEQHYLTPAIAWGTTIEVLTLAAVMIVCASDRFTLIDLGLALVGILVPIVWSGIAFRRMLNAERLEHPAQEAYDNALVAWHELLYCVEEDRIFELRPTAPTTRTVSEAPVSRIPVLVRPAARVAHAPTPTPAPADIMPRVRELAGAC